MANQNKANMYGLLVLGCVRRADHNCRRSQAPRADIGVIAVLHHLGPKLFSTTLILCGPGGGISPDGRHWIPCKPGFFLPVRVLSACSALYLEGLMAAFEPAELQSLAISWVSTRLRHLPAALEPVRTAEWIVYAKRTFAGSERLLAYLARYTHRVGSPNSRLLDLDETHVSFRWKKARQRGGRKKQSHAHRDCGVMSAASSSTFSEWLPSHSPLRPLGERHRADKFVLCEPYSQCPMRRRTLQR